MARLNIEDSLFRDKRFLNLTIKLCCSTTAVGACVEAWIIAQKFYTDFIKNGVGNGMIPQIEWDDMGIRNEIIEVGLAEKRGDFIYVKGTVENFDWYARMVNGSKKGGKSSAQRPRDDRGRLQASPSLSKPSLEKVQASPSPSSALTLTPALTLKELNTCRVPSKHMSFDFEIPYKQYPKRDGDQAKGKAIKKLKSKITTIEEFERFTTAVKNYASYVRKKGWENTEHVKMFFTFVNSDWTEWLEMKINGPKLITWEEEYGA